MTGISLSDPGGMNPMEASQKDRVKRERLDSLLIARGLAASKTEAQTMIIAGEVYLPFGRVIKPYQLVPGDTEITIKLLSDEYVSRGGLKMEGALDDLKMDVRGLVAVDVGSSTGGFTDCLLRRGVRHCFAVDVTPQQLHERLQRDQRVTSIKLNARYMNAKTLPTQVDLAVIDCSFISMGTLLQPVSTVIKDRGRILAMVKPQFEVGTRALKKGVVRDEADRKAAIQRISNLAGELGFELLAECDSRLTGPRGNREHFLLLEVPVRGTSEEASC